MATEKEISLIVHALRSAASHWNDMAAPMLDSPISGLAKVAMVVGEQAEQARDLAAQIEAGKILLTRDIP